MIGKRVRYWLIGLVLVFLFSLGFAESGNATESNQTLPDKTEWESFAWESVQIPENLVSVVVPSLFRSGAYSIPGDRCECIYWGRFRFVIHA